MNLFPLLKKTIATFLLVVLTTTPLLANAKQETSVCSRLKEEQVVSFFNQWNEAVKAKNLDAVVANYADNAVLLPTLSNIPRTNHAELRAYFTQFFKKNPSATIDTRVIKTGCDWASSTGLYTFQLEDGGIKKRVKARYTYVYELIDGQWLIISHHSSLMPEKNKEEENSL